MQPVVGDSAPKVSISQAESVHGDDPKATVSVTNDTKPQMGGQEVDTHNVVPRKNVYDFRIALHQNAPEPKLEHVHLLPESDEFLYRYIPPPELPPELNKYRSRFEELLPLAEHQEYDKAIKQARVLLGLLASNGGFADCIRYLNSIVLICALNRVEPVTIRHMTSVCRRKFIEWQLRIARVCEQGTPVVQRSRELTFHCLRSAADAGSIDACIALIKRFWLHSGDMDRSIFFPDEAIEYVRIISCLSSGSLPEGNCEIDRIIFRLAELSCSQDRMLRKKLSEELSQHRLVMFRLLAAAVYLEPQFGYVVPTVALETLSKTNPEQLDDLDIESYWTAKAWLFIANDDSVALKRRQHLKAKACDLLKTLWKRRHVASMTMLIRVYLNDGNSFQCLKCVTDISRNYSDLVVNAPSLAYSVYCCIAESDYPKRKQDLLAAAEMRVLAKELLELSLRQLHRQSRLAHLYGRSRPVLNTTNYKSSGSGSVVELPPDVLQLLQESPFSQNPIILTFQYVSIQLRDGRGGGEYIRRSMEVDPLTTCCMLISLDLASDGLLPQELIKKLLNIAPSINSLPKEWQSGYFCALLLNRMLHYRNVLFPQKNFLSFFSEVYHQCRPLAKRDDSRVPDELKEGYANYLLLCNNRKAAEKFYRLVEVRTNVSCSVSPDYQVFRRNTSPFVRLLSDIEDVQKTPMETDIVYHRLLLTANTLSADPEELFHWMRICQRFISHSPYHLHPDQVAELATQIETVMKKFHRLTRLLLRKSFTILLHTGEQLRCRLIENQGNESFDLLRSMEEQLQQLEELVPDDEDELSLDSENVRFPGNYKIQHEHHMLAEIAGTDSILKRLTLLVQCVKDENIDIYSAIKVGFRGIESLPADYLDEAVLCLALLVRLLIMQVSWIQDQKVGHNMRMIVVLQRFLEMSNHVEGCDGLRIMLEDKQLILMMGDWGHVSKEFSMRLSGPERKMYQEVSLLGEDFELQCSFLLNTTSFAGNLDYFFDFVRSRADPGEALATLEKMVEMAEYGHIRDLLKLSVKWFSGNGVREFILARAESSKVENKMRISLLFLGIRMEIVTSKDLERVLHSFAKGSAEAAWLQVLLAQSRGAIQKELCSLLTHCHVETRTRETAIWMTSLLMSPLLREGMLKEACQCLRQNSDNYEMAMMEWRHQQSETASGVVEKLLRSVTDSNVRAIYCMADWIIAHPDESELVKKRCLRFLFMPVLLVTAERKLYRGIFKYLGIGCDADKESIRLITEALESESPVPSLRLLMLVNCKAVKATIVKRNCWELFATRFYSCRKSFKDEWLLEFGLHNLLWLTIRLREEALHSDAELHACFRAAADEIESWCHPTLPENDPADSSLLSDSNRAVKPRIERSVDTPVSIEQGLVERLQTALQAEVEQLLADDMVDDINCLLRKLYSLQGSRFPGQLGIDQQIRGLECLFMARELSSATRILCERLGVERPSVIEQLREEFLASLEARVELSGSSLAEANRPDKNELEMLMLLLPDTVPEEGRLADVLISLAQFFSFDMPEPLLQLLCRRGNRHLLKEPLKSMQLCLLRLGDELKSSQNNKLLEVYYRCRSKFRNLDVSADISSAAELRQVPFFDLPSLGAEEFCQLVIHSPVLAVDRKVRLFNAQTVELKKACLAGGLPDPLCEGFYSMALSPRSRLKIRQAGRRVDSFMTESSVNIQVGLELCLAIKKIAPEMYGRVRKRLLDASLSVLQTPLKSWDGHQSRLWAMVTKKLADDSRI